MCVPNLVPIGPQTATCINSTGMLFLAMYTFVIVTMRLCGQRNTSQKKVNEAAR